MAKESTKTSSAITGAPVSLQKSVGSSNCPTDIRSPTQADKVLTTLKRCLAWDLVCV